MNARPFPALALAALLSAPFLRAEDPILLRHHWEAGKVYHFDINLDFEMTMPNAPGGGGTSTVILEPDVTVRQEAGTETKHAELKVTSVKAMVDRGGNLVTFDSANPALAEPTLREGLSILTGLVLTLVYDKDDVFKDVILPEGATVTPQTSHAGPGADLLVAIFREAVAGSLPGERLAPAGTFEQEQKMPFAEATVVKEIKGRFDSITDHEGHRQAKVVTEGTYQAAEVAEAPTLIFKGETLFDPERKAVTRSTLRADVKYPQFAVPMSVKLTTVATLKSITDASPEKK